MASVTHQIQGSYATFPSRPRPWNRGLELKRFVTTLHMVVRTDSFLSLKCKSCLSVGAPLVRGTKGKSLRISAFKGSAQNDELGGRSSGSKSAKNSVKLSYIPQESEETLTESPKEQNVPLSYASDSDERIAGSLAIQNLFKNWLALLRTPSPNQVVDEILEGPAPKERSEMQNGTQKKERSVILKAVWCYFLGLDATVKIPLLIFIPWYLAVNVVYGAEVSKELTPLWVLGPLIVALYIKMLRSICAFYVFSFKQTVKVVKNLPTYYLLAYNYIARGKLKEDVRAYFWQPVMNIKNLDYKELSKRKMKDLQVWAVEKYLDYVESIWPYYCRTIRFLKRANLI
uniref:Embryo defective 2759 n=1 Tax=Davidia involucrata TaxID=16924 RepID=A0A5B7AHV9_DAVIN